MIGWWGIWVIVSSSTTEGLLRRSLKCSAHLSPMPLRKMIRVSYPGYGEEESCYVVDHTQIWSPQREPLSHVCLQLIRCLKLSGPTNNPLPLVCLSLLRYVDVWSSSFSLELQDKLVTECGPSSSPLTMKRSRSHCHRNNPVFSLLPWSMVSAVQLPLWC